jgi:hypothetical protein
MQHKGAGRGGRGVAQALAVARGKQIILWQARDQSSPS